MSKVVVAAGHETVSRRIETASLEELIFQTSSAALSEAGLTRDALDAVVISGNDQTDGRIISCMVTAGPVGGVGKNVTTLASAPEHAFAYAVLRLLAGQGRNALVVGWSKPSESVFPEHAELVSADPFFARPLGLNAVVAAALQASTSTRGTPPPNPATGYLAWPLTANDYRGHADGVCAMVLESRSVADPRDPRPGAWVRGVGWAMDRYELGDREDLEAGGLEAALRQATEQAGPTFGPIRTLDASAVGAPNERRLAQRVVKRIGDRDTRISLQDEEEPRPDFAAGLAGIWRAAQAVMKSETAGREHAAAAVSTVGFAAQGATVVLLSTPART